jgi:hypothetical protein
LRLKIQPFLENGSSDIVKMGFGKHFLDEIY